MAGLDPSEHGSGRLEFGGLGSGEQVAARARSAPAGYRRSIRIEPSAGSVVVLLEDDFHAMRVVLSHDGSRVTAVDAAVSRAPWTTCPGAAAKLVETFAGAALTEVTARREKKQNCTHLHDMAVLAATHAHDAVTVYDVVADDPIDGARTLELWRDGTLVLQWFERDGVLTAPPTIAGRTLFTLRDWIATLPPAQQEAARLLQWSSLVAHGRTIAITEQSEAMALPASCFTFQPERAAVARRIIDPRDFSDGSRVPLAGIADIW